MADDTLDPRRTALVFFDPLKVYAYDPDLNGVTPEARAQVDAMVQLNAAARRAGIPVFYARADHRPDGKDAATAITDLDLARTVRPAAGDPFGRQVWGTEAANILDEIAPQPGDYQIYKHRWSMFFQTELELSLRARDVDTILLAGGSTEVGIASSAYAGRDLDFNIVLVRETMRSGRGPWISDFFVNEIAPGITRVRDLAQVLAALDASGAGTLAPAVPSTTRGEAPATLPAIPLDQDVPLDPRETALLLFDMLKGGHYDPQTRALRADAPPHVAACQRMLEVARRAGMPVFFTQPIHRADGADWCSALIDREGRPRADTFGHSRINPGSHANSWEAEVIDELAPQPGEYVIRKHRYSAFHGTHLALSLRTAGVKNVLLGGVATNAGVASTAYAARDHDFNLVVLRDCGRASNPAILSYLMDHAFPRMGRVRTVDQAAALLRSA